MQEIRANIRHLLRGEIYEIENETYFAFGGGETADPSLRTETATWWEEEMPSEEEMLHGLKTLESHGNRVDYILTHEPSGKACTYSGGPNARLDRINIYLNQIEDKVQFERWFFGSLHLDKGAQQTSPRGISQGHPGASGSKPAPPLKRRAVSKMSAGRNQRPAFFAPLYSG